MDNDKIESLLLRLLEEMAIVKSKLEALDDLKTDSKTINNRVDHIEAQNERHEKQLESLEKRASSMEQFVRNNMNDTRKQQTNVFISMGLAVFSVILNIVAKLF